jgi:hypothetical protein
MYSEFYKDYIAKAKKEGKEEGKDLSNEAFEATKFLENDKTAEYKFAYKWQTSLNLKLRKVHTFTV